MNSTENRETNNQSTQTESLADLPLTTEQAEETKAGASRSSVSSTGGAQLASFFAFQGFNGGVFVAGGDVN